MQDKVGARNAPTSEEANLSGLVVSAAGFPYCFDKKYQEYEDRISNRRVLLLVQ